MAEIWDSWVPGVLSKSQMKELCDAGFVSGSNSTAIDYSAIDLHLSDEGYRLVRGSVKPFQAGFLEQLKRDSLAERLEPDAEGRWVLEPRNTYLFRLAECLEGLCNKSLWGHATAKSSVGRLDVLARLIVDGMNHYERFTPDYLSSDSCEMYLEVTPITFQVLVRPGISLNQLRFFYGKPEECELKGREIAWTCLRSMNEDHSLTVDLTPVNILGVEGCGFRAVAATGDPIPLWKDGTDPRCRWELVQADKRSRLRIEIDRFYILRSKERLTLPAGIAIYARAIDEEIGEMRIHYAGFAHPFFGLSRSDTLVGTPLIFEVRGHNVDVSLRDQEILARLRFFRMSRDDSADKESDTLVGTESGTRAAAIDDSYSQQNLKLSNYFGEWSTPPRLVPPDDAD